MNKALLEKELDLFLEQQEVWKTDHEDAMLSWDAEEAVALGIHVFQRLNQADERNQLRAFREEISHDEAEGERARLMDLFRRLLPAIERLLRAIKYCSEKGYVIDRAEELAKWADEIRGILTSDEDFFAGEPLEHLREQALDALRRGAITELQEIDD